MIGQNLKRGLNLNLANPALISLKHLPFELGDLEPVISHKTMEIHYSRHHRGYVN